MRITEQWVLSHAPGPAVAEEARALSEKNRFLSRGRTEDALTCWGLCVGSARNPYYVSVDMTLSETEPVYSCSCSSRHFPCKHMLALLYDLLDGKPFEIGAPPAYVLRARTQQARALEQSAARLQKMRKYNATGREKKVERQLDALAKSEKLSDMLLKSGVASVAALPAQTLDRLAAELGNYSLPAVRDMFEHIALLDRQSRQEDADTRRCYVGILETLATLRALTGKARKFLGELRSSASYSLENPLLFEALGGVWNDDELREIGSYRKAARLVQLSFDVSCDEAKHVYTERGFWLDLTRGDIVRTGSPHASRTLDYGGTDNSCFDLLEVPVLYESPIAPCPHVWWDDASAHGLTDDDRAAVLRCADARLAEVLDHARQQLKDPLLPPVFPALVAVGAVGTVDGTPVLADREGARIALCDRAEDGAEHASTSRLRALPATPAEGDALFGLVFYDEDARKLCLHPYSLVTAADIFRLHY